MSGSGDRPTTTVGSRATMAIFTHSVDPNTDPEQPGAHSPEWTASINGTSHPAAVNGIGLTHGVDAQMFDEWITAHPDFKDAMFALSEEDLAALNDTQSHYGFEATPPFIPSAPTEPPASVPPVNVDVPVVSRAGDVLTCTTGTWTNAPTTYAHQWKLDGTTDIGTDSPSYVVTSDDVGHTASCIVTASNAAGSAAAPPSNDVTIDVPPEPVTAPPVIVDIPVASQSGAILSCTVGTWIGEPTEYAYEWVQDDVSILGTDPTYEMTSPDVVGHTATCTVTATNAFGSTEGPVSNGVIIVPFEPPVNVDVPYVWQVEETLACTMGNWLNEPTAYSYQWQRDGVNVGIDSDTYTVMPTDVGHSATCIVTATNALGSTVAPPSTAVVMIGAAYLASGEFGDNEMSGLVGDLASNGSAWLGFDITVDGALHTVRQQFGGVATAADVCAKIDAILGAYATTTVPGDAEPWQFIIASNTTGDASTITYAAPPTALAGYDGTDPTKATTDISNTLRLRQSAGATVTQGNGQ